MITTMNTSKTSVQEVKFNALILNQERAPFTNKNGWKQSTIWIRLPAENVKRTEDSAPELEVPDVYHHSLLEVFITAFRKQAPSHSITFHSVFSGSLCQRVHLNTFIQNFTTCMHFLRSIITCSSCHQNWTPSMSMQLQQACSGHLANFGTQLLWPGYTFFGNQSKYGHRKPSQFAVHHFGYIPSVSHFFL